MHSVDILFGLFVAACVLLLVFRALYVCEQFFFRRPVVDVSTQIVVAAARAAHSHMSSLAKSTHSTANFALPAWIFADVYIEHIVGHLWMIM